MHQYIRFYRKYVILKNASYISCTARYVRTYVLLNSYSCRLWLVPELTMAVTAAAAAARDTYNLELWRGSKKGSSTQETVCCCCCCWIIRRRRPEESSWKRGNCIVVLGVRDLCSTTLISPFSGQKTIILIFYFYIIYIFSEITLHCISILLKIDRRHRLYS